MTVQAFQELGPILAMVESDGRVPAQIIDALQLVMNLLLQVLESLFGGPLGNENGKLTVDDDAVDEESLNKLLGDGLLQQILDIISKLLQNILDVSSPGSVTNILDGVKPLLESILGTLSNDLDNVQKSILGILNGVLDELQKTVSETEDEPCYHEVS